MWLSFSGQWEVCGLPLELSIQAPSFFSLQCPGQPCVRASLRSWSPRRLRAPARWTDLSHSFPRMLAEQPGWTPGKEARAKKSASSGEGREQGLGTLLGVALKAKRDCRSLQLPAFLYSFNQSSPTLLPSTQNCKSPPTSHQKERKKKEKKTCKSPSPFSPSLPSTLPSSPARLPSLPLPRTWQPPVSPTGCLSDGTQQLLGYFSPPFPFSPPFAMNWTGRRREGCAFCPREWWIPSWGQVGEGDRPRRKKSDREELH